MMLTLGTVDTGLTEEQYRAELLSNVGPKEAAWWKKYWKDASGRSFDPGKVMCTQAFSECPDGTMVSGCDPCPAPGSLKLGPLVIPPVLKLPLVLGVGALGALFLLRNES